MLHQPFLLLHQVFVHINIFIEIFRLFVLLFSLEKKKNKMLEHLIYVNTWYPKYEVELAEQTHYKVFVRIDHQSHPIDCSFSSRAKR